MPKDVPLVEFAGKKDCVLRISNKAGKLLNLVIQGTDVSLVKAMTVRRHKRLKLPKGTYVIELWLSEGRISIKPVNIPHISIEKITGRKDVNIRGRRIVADLVNDRTRIEVSTD